MIEITSFKIPFNQPTCDLILGTWSYEIQVILIKLVSVPSTRQPGTLLGGGHFCFVSGTVKK